MHDFLINNRDELIARCKDKVARRPQRSATAAQLSNGVPMFLDQLTRTLAAEGVGDAAESRRISGASGGNAVAVSEMGVSAIAHGKSLLELGFTVAQVVHDYGDLCQAITDLAVERDAPFSVDEFRTLNRCLDNAIADAVKEFSAQREASLARSQHAAENERLGFLVHELRNRLNTVTLAITALEAGNLSIQGSTGAVLKRSAAAMAEILTSAIAEVSLTAGKPVQRQALSVASLVDDAKMAASLYGSARGCAFLVSEVDPGLFVLGNQELLAAALLNLLHNAFKFTRAHTTVTLSAYAEGERVWIDVKDHCGGLAPGSVERMFLPFTQLGVDKSGLGLGLSIAKKGVESSGGELSVQNVPGVGCIFRMNLPRQSSS